MGDTKNILALDIKNIPEGHLIVGHISYVKLLDTEGREYWALRQNGLNMMESIGCASDMLNEVSAQVSRMEIPPPE